MGRAEADGCGEIISDLGEDTRDVDGVDSGQLEPVSQREIGEQVLHDPLAVVECAVYSQVVHVGVHDGRHLRFLDRADLAMRVHDEDRHILLSAQAVDGG